MPVCNGGRAWRYWATSVTRPRTDAILFFSNCLSVSGVVSASLVTEEDAPGQCARVLPAPAASDGNQCLSHSRLCCLVIVAPVMTPCKRRVAQHDDTVYSRAALTILQLIMETVSQLCQRLPGFYNARRAVSSFFCII